MHFPQDHFNVLNAKNITPVLTMELHLFGINSLICRIILLVINIAGLVQDCYISNVLALKILQFCTEQSIPLYLAKSKNNHQFLNSFDHNKTLNSSLPMAVQIWQNCITFFFNDFDKQFPSIYFYFSVCKTYKA